MKAWVSEYVKEIDAIEEFFIDKFNSLVEQFINMQVKYLTKLDKEADAREESETHSKIESVMTENINN